MSKSLSHYIRTFSTLFFLVLLGLITPFLILEVGMRIDQAFRLGKPFFQNPSSTWDDRLGWVGTEHKIGDSTQNPILVLGDSFTDGLGVPSEKLWFAPLATQNNQSLIAYGGMGYGTLQELLVLEDYRAKGLTPSLVILQMCSNDIINNSFELERESIFQRAPAPRPYLKDGEITLRFPRTLDRVLLPLISVSRFLYKQSVRWEMKVGEWAKAGKVDSIENKITHIGFGLKEFHDASKTTALLVKRIKEVAAPAPLLLMLVDTGEPYRRAIIDIAKENNTKLFIPRDHITIPTNGFHADGTHFNEIGNQALGLTFAKEVSDFMKKPVP